MYKIKTLRYIFLYVPILILFLGCAPKNIIHQTKHTIDLQKIVDTNSIKPIQVDKELFWKKFLKPWQIKRLRLSKKEASWANKVFYSAKYYAENRLPWKKNEIKSIINQTNFNSYNQAPFYAITTKSTQVRN